MKFDRVLDARIPFEPRKHQRDAHDGKKRFSVLVWHRRAGKTVFAIVELIVAAMKCERERGRFAYISPLLKQSKDIAWSYLKAFTGSVEGCTYNETELSVRLPNGASIRLYGADYPDSLRGIYLDGVVLDEVADMRPQVWGEVIRPLLTDREGWALFIGTPKGINLFSERYYAALQDSDWYADLKRASDTGVIPATEIEQSRREMSGPQFAQEFECDFAAASENALVPLSDALAASKREVPEESYAFAARVLGVDVARYGDDRTVFFPRQGLMSFEPRILRGLDTMAVASAVAESADKFGAHAVFIDETGLGAGVVDRLRQLGRRDCIGVNFGAKPLDERNENRRAEMWRLMADWIRAGGVLPSVRGLVEELCAPTFTYANARGRFQLESKDDIKARGLPSPDVADALALTFAAPVAAPEPRTFLRGGSKSVDVCISDYHPLEAY